MRLFELKRKKRLLAMLLMIVAILIVIPFSMCYGEEKEFELREITIKGKTNNYFELGTAVTLSVTSNYGSKDVQYKFSYQYADEDIKVISNYSKEYKVDWTPDLSGIYLIIAEGKTNDGQYAKETKELSVINPSKVEITNIKFNKESPQKIGESITINISADNGTRPYKYKFDFTQTKDGKIQTTSSEWLDVGTYIWTPEEIGTYTMIATVEDAGGQIITEERTYEIIQKLGVVERKWTDYIKPIAAFIVLIAAIIFLVKFIKKRVSN